MLQAEQDFLVLAAQEGDKRAFTLLYHYYNRPILHYAYKVCGNTELSQEAVQEAWIKALRNLKKLDDPRAFRSWLYTLVRWRCLDLLRVASRNTTEPLDQQDENETSTEQEADHSQLRQTINSLPSVEKEMIHLFYLEQMSVAEIAIVLKIPPGTVKSRLSRARARLKEKLS